MANEYIVRIGATVDLTKARAEMAAFMKEYQNLVIGGGATGGKGGTTGGAAGGMEKTGQAAKKSATMIGSFTSELKNLKSTIPKVAAFGVATAAIGTFTTAIKDGVGAVVEMDKALTEFKRVSTLSGVGLDEYAKKASAMGAEVARTGAQMVNAATEFRRSGFGDYDSLELAKVASMFQNVADSEMSAGDAAGFIVSQMKAFEITASNSQHIIDAVNQTAAKFAVSTTDISTALSKTSSAMGVLGNSYEETIGLVTAGTEILHGQASKTARGLDAWSDV